MSVKHERGKFGEDYTADYLINKGAVILARNFRRKGGELDIVALYKNELIIVEVKTRKFGSLTDGIEAVTKAKMKNIISAAQRYIDENDIEFSGMRFDVAELVITTDKVPRVLEFSYYEDAFSADDLDICTAML